MAKLTLNDIESGYLTHTAYNANNTLIETALENTLSRDGTTPNQMGVNLDMNSHRVLNLAQPINSNEAARLIDVQNAIAGSTAANLVSFTPYANIASDTVQGAIQEEVDDLAASSGTSLVGHISTKTGAVATTAQTKLRESISVWDFMTPAQITAVTTVDPANPTTSWAFGAGSDCTAAFNAAFAIRGASIYIPAGGYTISSNLTPPICGKIYGDGWRPGPNYLGTVLDFSTGVTAGLELRGSNCLEIEDIVLLGNTTTNAVGILIGNSTYHTAGTFVIGETYTITVLGTTDFTLIGAASNTLYLNFTATGVGTGTGAAVQLHTWDYGKINNVRVLNFNGTNAKGMYLRDANFCTFTDLHLDNSTTNLVACLAQPLAGTVPADCWFYNLTASSSSQECIKIHSGFLHFYALRVSGATKEAILIHPAGGDIDTHSATVWVQNAAFENCYDADPNAYQIRVVAATSGNLVNLRLSGLGHEMGVLNARLLSMSGQYADATLTNINIITSPKANWINIIDSAKLTLNDMFYAADTGGYVDLNATGSLVTGTSGSITGNAIGHYKFPPTQFTSSDANTLDDYEEGLTSVLTVTCGAGTAALVSGFDQLKYTKIGRQVHLTGRLAFGTVTAASGSLTIGSLPFANGSGNYSHAAISIEGSILTAGGGATPLQGSVAASGTTISIKRLLTGVNTDDISGFLVTNNSELRLSITYSV